MIDGLLKYWPFALFVLNGLGFWVSWSVRKGVATRDDLTVLEKDTKKELSALKDRLTHVEASIKNGPTHGDLKRLHHRLDGLGSQLSELIGEFAGASRTLNMLHEYLLEEGKRR